ncbi:MAG: hypothetical protein KAW40_04095, partial [Candidatus Aenigmarchaeota archaeon]|nr:hypothetical protein [Candidatus Aenigmarchaeota archaeon]
YFFFQIMDEENEWNTSIISLPTLERSNITIEYREGNNSEVSITSDSSNSTLFLLNVSDDDNQTVPLPMNITIYVQKNDTDWDSGFINQTNSSGYLVYNFAPNCSYEAGIRKWYAESTDIYYEQKQTENFTVIMNGTLVNTLITPQGLEVLRSLNVTIQVRVNDSCGKNITDANLTIRMVSNKTSQTFYCDNITHVGDGYYNCTFNTSSPSVMPAMGYEIIVNSSKESYISDLISVNYSLTSSFFIETKPVIENNTWSLTPSEDWGWGETYTFTVNVSDEDDDNMTMEIWVNVSTGWDNIYTNSTVKGVNQTVTYVYSGFDNDDIGQRQYVINVTDDGDYPRSGGSSYNDTTPIENFTLDKDNISIEILLGNESVVQRNVDSFTFKVRVWDIDKDPDETIGNAQKGKFWYTEDEETWIEYPSAGYKYTNENGNLTFESSEIGGVNCSFEVRPQKWKAGILTETEYKDTNSTNVSWTVVTTPLNASMWLSSDHYLRGVDNITSTANITESDGCGQVSGACVVFHVPQENEDCPLSGCAPEIGNGIYECNITPDRHVGWNPGIWYNVTMNATKTYYNGTSLWDNESELFYLATNPYFTGLQAIRSGGSGSTGGWGETWEFQADLYDLDSDYNNVSLYVNLTGGWEKIDESLNEQTGSVSFPNHQFNCSALQGQSSSQKKFNFTSIDVWNYTNTSVANFTLEKDDTSGLESSGYGVSIDRDFDDTEIFVIYIVDDDNGSVNVGSGVDGAFWTTTNASQPSVYIVAATNQTDSGGYLRYTFNPNCSYTVGDHYWRAGVYQTDTCYKGASSATDPENTDALPITILGQLKTNLTEPNETYASNILVGDNVTFRFGVPTDCSGIGINESYQTGLSVVKLELQDPDSQWENCTQGGSINDEGNGWYNCTWETKWHKGGNYTVRMTVKKTPDYNDNITVLTDYLYLNNTPPDYGNFSVDPLEDGWGAVFNYSVDAWDLQEDNVTCKLFVKTNNYGGQWILKNQTIVYGGRSKCSLTVSDFDCLDIGDDSVNAYMFELDDETNLFNATSQSGPNITVDSVDISYYYGNLSKVNRSNDEPENTTLLMVFVNDTDNGQPADANVTFWVTTNSSDPDSWDSGNVTVTNSSGHANVSFNPGCTPKYSVGNQSWKAGVTDGCYAEVNTTKEFNLTIYGTLSNTIYTDELGVGSQVLRGNNITEQVYVESDCWDEMNDANVMIELINEDNVTIYNCTPVYLTPSDGVYECKWNTTGMKARWYDTRANSSRTLYNFNTTTLENHFFIETKPELFNEMVLKNPAGWGEERLFNVTVDDEDTDNVTVQLYIRCLETATGSCPGIYSDNDWHMENEIIIEAPVNEIIQLNLSDNFYGIKCPTIGNWSYRFNATDDRVYKNSTAPHNFTVEKNDVIYQPSAGYDNPMVWRNGTDSVLLSVRVWDNDSGEYIGLGNATVWVTNNASDPNSWDQGKYMTVDGDGYINFSFFDDGEMPIHECNYTVGLHNWTAGMGGINEDNCYKTSNSSIYNLSIWSELRPDVVSPTGTQGFLDGDLINISGYVEDDCSYRLPHGAEGVTLDPSSGTQRYILEGEGGYPTTYCTGNWQEEEGWYNCSWPSGLRRCKWDIIMSVDKDYYAPNSTTEVEAFHLGTAPWLSNPSVSPTSEGWGYRFAFQVDFGDSDRNPNDISLWKSLDNQSWDFVDIEENKISSSTTITFYERFTCADSNQTPGKVNYYKFNVTDPYNYTDETSPLTFNITEDSVTLTLNYSASSDEVRRIGSDQALLKFRIRDDDYSYQNPNGSYYPSGVDGLVWVTGNGTNYTNVLQCTSSDGHCEVNYNPNCSTSLAGIQQWKGGTNDTCYEYENSTNETVDVIGQLYVSIVNPVPNIIINRNTTAVFNATVKDDCNLSINDSTVTWYNESWDILNSSYNTTWLVPYNYPLGPNVIRANTSRTNYDGNTNSTSLYIYGWAELDEMYPPNETVYLASGTSKIIKCHIRDANTLMNLTNYTVDFYINDTYDDTSNTSDQAGEEGNASFFFSTNRPAGWYKLTCKINSSSYWYYNVSTPNITHLVRVSRPLIIDQIVRDPSNGKIFRNDTSGYSPYQVNITVHLEDADLPGAGADNATVWFYNHSHAYIGNCTTNSSGWCNQSISWNPDDGTTPDYYTIYINATKPSTNEPSVTNTTVIDVMGIYIANITSPVNGSLYGKGVNIPFNASIRDENWNWFIGTMWVYWYNDTGDFIEDTISGEEELFYSGMQDTGYRNFTARSQPGLLHHYSENDTVTVQITGSADVEWFSPPNLSSVTYPYEFQRICRVVDIVSQTGVNNYPVNFSYWNETSSQWVYNGTYLTNSSGHTNTSWSPWDKGNVTFNCTIWDNSTLEYTTNIDSVSAIIWVKDDVLPTIENISVIPNQSIEAWLNTTNITADVTDDYGIENNGVWAYIGLPNGSYENKTMSFVENNTYRYEYLPKLNGTYNVTVYAKDEGPENNVNHSDVYYFEVWGKVNGKVDQMWYVYAGGITQTDDFKFNLTINFTNLGPPNAYYVNLTIYDDSPGYVDYNESSYYCGNMTNGSLCQWTVEVTILPATPPTSINVFGNASWMDPDRTDASVVNSTYVVVASNPIVEILETGINKTVPHDQQTYVDNITIYSSGNDRVTNIQLSNAGGNFDYDCYDCVLTMVPSYQGDLFAGYNFTSDIWVTIPKGKPPGIYWTYVVANSTNAGSDIYLLNLSVDLNTSWIRTPDSFPAMIAQPNTNGLIGQVNVTNEGNVKIYFWTSPREAAASLIIVTPAAFAVDTLSKRTINISYLVPPAYPEGMYYGVVAIRNDTLPADPVERTVSFWLNVTDLPPNITDYSVIPTEFEVGF